MADAVFHDPTKPITVRRGQRFKIKTRTPPSNVRVRGQDATVSIILDDGTEVLCPNVMSASWRVDSRQGYCTGEFVVTGVEVEVDGVLEDETIARLEGECARLRREVADLREELYQPEPEKERGREVNT